MAEAIFLFTVFVVAIAVGFIATHLTGGPNG